VTDYNVVRQADGLFLARAAIGFQPGEIIPLSLPAQTDDEEDEDE